MDRWSGAESTRNIIEKRSGSVMGEKYHKALSIVAIPHFNILVAVINDDKVKSTEV
jgi:hypothetical protein